MDQLRGHRPTGCTGGGRCNARVACGSFLTHAPGNLCILYEQKIQKIVISRPDIIAILKLCSIEIYAGGIPHLGFLVVLGLSDL